MLSLPRIWVQSLLWELRSCKLHTLLVTQSCPTLCDSVDCSLPGSSVHRDSPGKNTRVGCHALLQGIFPTQGLNPGLLHYKQILYCLSHEGSTAWPQKHSFFFSGKGQERGQEFVSTQKEISGTVKQHPDPTSTLTLQLYVFFLKPATSLKVR